MVFQISIDLANGATHWGIDRGGRLGRFYLTNLLPCLDDGTRLRHIDENDIAQRILGKMTDTNCGLCAAHAHPFMLMVVTEVFRNHARSPSEKV